MKRRSPKRQRNQPKKPAGEGNRERATKEQARCRGEDERITALAARILAAEEAEREAITDVLRAHRREAGERTG